DVEPVTGDQAPDEAADDGADDPHHDVENPALPGVGADDLAGDPTRQRTENDPGDDPHVRPCLLVSKSPIRSRDVRRVFVAARIWAKTVPGSNWRRPVSACTVAHR